MLHIALCDDNPASIEILEKYFDILNDSTIDYDVYFSACKLRSNGMPVPLLRNGYSIFNGTKYR